MKFSYISTMYHVFPYRVSLIFIAELLPSTRRGCSSKYQTCHTNWAAFTANLPSARNHLPKPRVSFLMPRKDLPWKLSLGHWRRSVGSLAVGDSQPFNFRLKSILRKFHMKCGFFFLKKYAPASCIFLDSQIDGFWRRVRVGSCSHAAAWLHLTSLILAYCIS